MKRLFCVSEWIVAIVGFIIGLILIFFKCFYAFNPITDEYGMNIIHVLIGVVIYYTLFRMINIVNGKQESVKKGIVINIMITLMFEIVFLVFLFKDSIIYYSTEAGAVYNLAVQFLNGNYAAIAPIDSYLAIYPQQYGIILIMEIMMRILGTTNGLIFQLMNITLVILFTLAGYGITWEICPDINAISVYTLLQITFFPICFYTATVYGDLPATCLTVIAVYLLVRVFKGAKYQVVWRSLASLAIVFSCIFKKNALICLIGIVLVSLVILMKKFEVSKFLWLLLTIILAVMANPLIQKTYELRAGQESGEGIPMITYISMGMQDGLEAPGSWNGYHTDLFLRNNYNSDETSRQAMCDIKDRLLLFKEKPLYMFELYSKKTSFQWTDGSFDGTEWGLGSAFGEGKSPWIVNLMEGPAYRVFVHIGNWHQSMVYFLFVFSTFGMIKTLRKKRDLDYENMLLTVIVIGGFLFSLIWESSSRYVLMYYTMLLPLGAGTCAQFILRKVKI